jgi:hypothetical protein
MYVYETNIHYFRWLCTFILLYIHTHIFIRIPMKCFIWQCAFSYSAPGRDKPREKEAIQVDKNGGGGGSSSSGGGSGISSSTIIKDSKQVSKSVKEKAPAPSLALTLAPSSTTTPNVMNPPTSNNVTSWQLTNERGMMKNQVLTISKIAHPLNSMHSCYTITCTGNQCPSVRKCYPLVCMYAFLCVCMYVSCQSMIRYVSM